jgi:hypothetical protein
MKPPESLDYTSSEALHFDPIDWQQLQLLAQLTPAQRTLTMIRAAEFVRAGLRGALRRRFPDLSDEEINMKVLAHLTPLRGFHQVQAEIASKSGGEA